jgi:hypothetical protein
MDARVKPAHDESTFAAFGILAPLVANLVSAMQTASEGFEHGVA